MACGRSNPDQVLLDDACCEPDEMAYNRLREEPVLEILPFDPERHAGCWPWPPDKATGGGACPPCEPEQEDTDCFAPDCPCEDCVPLALLIHDPQRGLVIDTGARRRVRSTLATLTRIAHINWPHGGRLSSREIAEDLKGRLEICFSRRLMDPGPRPGTGIGRATFEVTYTESQGDFEVLPAARRPWVTEDGCKAVFEIAERAVRGLRRGFVRIRVLGDFVLDVHGNPVDADFLGATLPTGDGIAGGTFESWFWIGDDDSAIEEAGR
jgi:hypothetical protein